MSGRSGYDADAEGEPRISVWKRLSSAGRGSGAAVATGAIAMGSGTKDALESMRDHWGKGMRKLDKWAADNFIGRVFQFKERGAKASTEMRAGLITFLMVSYILAVNPSILATTGGTCDPVTLCSAASYEEFGPQCLTMGADPAAQECMTQLVRSLVTATAAASLISTAFMGHWGNLPLALAPGIGINAYVAYQVVGQYGDGELTYQQAMAAIFVEGWIFMLLSITGVRGGIIKYMPKSIAMASSVGIGMLLAFTGLRSLGVIVWDSATLVTLGGCPANHRNYLYAFSQPLNASSLASLTPSSLPPYATVYGCVNQNMRSPTMWLGIAGGFISCLLLYLGVKGSLIIGIAFVTIISWIPGHGASYLGAGSSIPGGQARLDFFAQVVAAPTLSATGLAWDWSAFTTGKLWVALFTFLYIDLLDCTGTLLSMARLLDYEMPGFLSPTLEFPGQMWAFLSDGIGIVAGSMMGTTPLTVYIESAAGIEDGGRTGLTAVTVSFFFLVSLFFSPILASIPPYATGPALVLVGTILLGHIAHIEWDDVGVAIPAFLTITLMPFTYSVAYGVIAGLLAYVAIHLPFWLADWARARWGKGARDASPGAGPAAGSAPDSARGRRTNKMGGYRRGAWGGGDQPPSRTESYLGDPRYQDSFHSTDSRRSGLPLTAIMGGGAAGAGLPLGGPPGSVHGSVPTLYFPADASYHRGRSGSYGMTSDGEAPAQPPPGSLALFRKSHSLHSPGRGLADGGAGGASGSSLAAMLGYRTSHPQPVRQPQGPRGASPTRHVGFGSSAGTSPGGPGSYRAATLVRQSSLGRLDGQPPARPPAARALMGRSRTFSHGVSQLGAGDDTLLPAASSSDHGGNLYQQFMAQQARQARQALGLGGDGEGGASGGSSFKLFGDVEPLPLALSGSMSGEFAAAAAAAARGDGGGGTTTSSKGELAAEGSFRLFGDVEPLELHSSGPVADTSGEGGRSGPSAEPSVAQQQQGLLSSALRASFEVQYHDGQQPGYSHYASTHDTLTTLDSGVHMLPPQRSGSLTLRPQTSSLSDSDREPTADLTFGGAPRRGSSAAEPQLHRGRSFASLPDVAEGEGGPTSAPLSEEGSARGQRLALAAMAVRKTFSSSSLASEEGARAAAAPAEPEAAEPGAAAAAAAGPSGMQHRQQSGEVQQVEAEEAYDRMLSKLGSSSSSRRGRSTMQLTGVAPGAAIGSGSEGGDSRASSVPTAGSLPRTPIRSSSLRLAAQQLEMLQQQEDAGSGGGGPQQRPLSPDRALPPIPPSLFDAALQQQQQQRRQQWEQQQQQQQRPSPFDVEHSSGPQAPPRHTASLPAAPTLLLGADERELRQVASANAAGALGGAGDPSSLMSGLVADLEESE